MSLLCSETFQWLSISCRDKSWCSYTTSKLSWPPYGSWKACPLSGLRAFALAGPSDILLDCILPSFTQMHLPRTAFLVPCLPPAIICDLTAFLCFIYLVSLLLHYNVWSMRAGIFFLTVWGMSFIFYFFNYYFHWSIVDLQYCVSFGCIA